MGWRLCNIGFDVPLGPAVTHSTLRRQAPFAVDPRRTGQEVLLRELGGIMRSGIKLILWHPCELRAAEGALPGGRSPSTPNDHPRGTASAFSTQFRTNGS
jgi:hypothetical protein